MIVLSHTRTLLSLAIIITTILVIPPLLWGGLTWLQALVVAEYSFVAAFVTAIITHDWVQHMIAAKHE